MFMTPIKPTIHHKYCILFSAQLFYRIEGNFGAGLNLANLAKAKIRQILPPAKFVKKKLLHVTD